MKKFTHIQGLRVFVSGDDSGYVHDLLVDEATWTVRYFVIETDGWLSERRFLLTPSAIDRLDEKELHVSMDRHLIGEAPSFTGTTPTLADEAALRKYFGWAPYRTPEGRILSEEPSNRKVSPSAVPAGLYGLGQLLAFELLASDGNLGSVTDFLIDGTWVVQTVVASTGSILPGKEIALSPGTITRIDLERTRLEVALTVEEVRAAPEPVF